LAQQLPWVRLFAEAAAIVISILLAFGIQAAWETAGEHAREQRYLQSLRGEFAEAKTQLAEDEQWRTMALHAHEALIDQIQHGVRAPRDSLLSWTSATSLPLVFRPPQAVFDDMVSSGGTQLIRSDSLRVALARYGSRLSLLRERDDAAWATWEQRIQPFLEGRIPRVDRLRKGLVGASRPLPFDESSHRTDFAEVIAEPAFEDMVAERWLRITDAYQRFGELSQEIDVILDLIDREASQQQ